MLVKENYSSGLDNLVENKFKILKGLKVGVLANQASVNKEYKHLVDLLIESNCVEVKKIFGPEHGFRGELQDMETVSHTVDPKTKITVISLYGSSADTLVPDKEDLKDIDVLICDLPDIGSRYYTFSQTIAYTMSVAKEIGIKIILLDRANPINGVDFEGLGLASHCRSFCGYGPVPHRYGLSLGELLKIYNDVGIGTGQDFIPPIGADLEVISSSNWDRNLYADEIPAYPWVLPSPNMPTVDTAVIYPGSCLFEATEVSEGRGTTKPLEQFGAPYIDPEKWIEEFFKSNLGLDGFILRPTYFVPKFQKHAGQTCGGVQLHVTDRKKFKPFRTCLTLIASLKNAYPKDFAWRKQAFEFIDKVPAIDLLYGNSNFRETVEAGDGLEACFKEIKNFEDTWSEVRKKWSL